MGLLIFVQNLPPIISGTGEAMKRQILYAYSQDRSDYRNKSPLKMSRKVAVGVDRDSRKFSGQRYIGCIARLCLRQHSFLVAQCSAVMILERTFLGTILFHQTLSIIHWFLLVQLPPLPGTLFLFTFVTVSPYLVSVVNSKLFSINQPSTLSSAPLTHPSASDSVVFLRHCTFYKFIYLLTYLLPQSVIASKRLC